ncbi:MAG: hypothetical protein LH478_00980 [Chitinophagaceae bacterium]|nr:hypothetical protein [Chitinophagaceae bacterium]
MTQTDIKDKVMKGGKLAIERLLEKKRKDNSFVVISNNGNVVKVKANTLRK